MNTVQIENRSNEDLPLEFYRACALFVLEHQGVRKDAELAVSFVDNEEMQALNQQYRSIDAPTDVLSFECDGLDDAFSEISLTGEAFLDPLEDVVFLLGDVVIAPAIARQHSNEFESTFDEEMSLILIHGILHLLGYDHDDDDEYAVMRALEDELLALWNEQAASLTIEWSEQ